MLILFDHGTPAPLAPFLTEHTVSKTKDLGWDTLTNGELLKVAEEAGFELLLTTDKIETFVINRILRDARLRFWCWPILDGLWCAAMFSVL